MDARAGGRATAVKVSRPVDPQTCRIGMITPSSNTVLEPVTYRLLTGVETVTVHFSRLPVTRITTDDEQSAQFNVASMVAAGELLADARVDAIVWNGTSGSWLGVEHDHAIVSELTERTGIPMTTSTLALIDCFRAYGVTRLGLVTPYVEQVNALIARSYQRHGVEVVAEEHLGITDNEAFGRVDPQSVAQQVRQTARGVDAVAVVCTNINFATVAPRLEDELRVPVLDSVAVTLWGALRAAGSTLTLPQWGTVLRDGTLRARLQALSDEVRRVTRADRTTIRLDVPAHALHVNRPAAESVRQGMCSMRHSSDLDQRRLDTVAWLERHRAPLVQTCFEGDPMPPGALIDTYGVKAQVLVPVEHGGQLTGWVSVHSATERAWSTEDVAAIEAAASTVAAEID